MLALAALLFGCSPGTPVPLLTGVDGCWAGGETGLEGDLVADPEYGTRFGGKPVMWPLRFTAVRTADGEVDVRGVDGQVVATTGRRYFISRAPVRDPERDRVLQRLEAFPAAANCGYPWDLYEVR